MHNEGHCHCGQVQFSVEGDPIRMAQCHCNACRRLSGTGHQVQAFFKQEDVTINGEVSSYTSTADSGNTLTRSFCPKCGSRLFNRNTARQGVIGITMGTFDDGSWFKPETILYTSERYDWDPIDHEIPAFDAMPS